MVPATISVIFRNIFDRVDLTSPHQRTGLPSGIRFNRWQRILRRLEIGPHGAAKFHCATDASDSSTSAEIAARIPRMTALMSLASA